MSKDKVAIVFDGVPGRTERRGFIPGVTTSAREHANPPELAGVVQGTEILITDEMLSNLNRPRLGFEGQLEFAQMVAGENGIYNVPPKWHVMVFDDESEPEQEVQSDETTDALPEDEAKVELLQSEEQ